MVFSAGGPEYEVTPLNSIALRHKRSCYRKPYTYTLYTQHGWLGA